MKQAKQANPSELNQKLSPWLITLQTCLQLSESQLANLLNAQSSTALAALSPLKRSKNTNSTVEKSSTELCWRILMRLITIRSCELSLDLPAIPTLSEVKNLNDLYFIWRAYEEFPFATNIALTTLPRSVFDEPVLLKLVTEIALLDSNELTAEFLAALPPQANVAEQYLRKRTGSYYTPPELARTIAARTFIDFPSNNGCPTVLDPACGSGMFLIAALEIAVQKLNLGVTSIIPNLYGLDFNPFARDLTLISVLRCASQLTGQRLEIGFLEILAKHICVGNALIGNSRARKQSHPDLYQDIATLNAALAALPIFNSPSDGVELSKLTPFHWATSFPEIFRPDNSGFDFVIGNPPYLGFNDYSGIEKAYFSYAYPEVYNLKNDLLYYFIRRGVDLLKEGGRLGFVTSRLWKEAVWASRLRSWLAVNTTLEEIEDLNTSRLFAGATVDVCLIYLTKHRPTTTHHFNVLSGDFSEPASTIGFPKQSIAQSKLGASAWTWIHRSDLVSNLLLKIKEQSVSLGDVAICRTGVQTGYDKAFFIPATVSNTVNAEEYLALFGPELVKRSIKNSDIKLNGNAVASIEWNGLHLLYPPPDLSVEDCMAKYPFLAQHLEVYRARLSKRQRYEATFPFCQLQWPREPGVFQAIPKIVTPYKAPFNIFAVDLNGYFFSTDVISIVFTRNSSILNSRLENVAAKILCSHLSTFQFRSFSKQVGGGQYDYYANPIKRLVLPSLIFTEKTASTGSFISKEHLILEALANPAIDKLERDELVYQLYNLTSAEIDLIKAHTR